VSSIKTIIVACIVMATVQLSLAQQDYVSSGEQQLKDALHVYVDCNYCDMDYIRREIPYVNYVRDYHDAQVDVLVTTQTTGAGGTEYTLTFLGQKNFANINDTLKYVSEKNATQDDIRQGLTRTLKLGLVRYVIHTPVADNISLSYRSQETTQKVKDKWNYWVFGASMNTYANGQKSTNSLSLYGRIYANRITPDWKFMFSASGNYHENNFDIAGQKITSISRGKSINASLVKGLGEHWSLGLFGGYRNSSYSNIRHRIQISPEIEYSVFPYSESTHHELRIDYGVNAKSLNYEETTIYYKDSEVLFSQFLSLNLTFKKPWGSTYTSLSASDYFHDFSKNRLELFSQLQLRLFSGFSLNLFGSVSRVHDQLNLPLSGASQEEVLLRRKELATTYSYFVSFGLSYTFGAVYTNIVNPRFGTGSRSFYISW